MKKIIFGWVCVIILSGCHHFSHPTNVLSEDVAALKAELAQVKNTQEQIARSVGLGELVRPDTLELSSGQRIGDDGASIVVLEFTDLHCPFCLRFHQDVWPTLKTTYIDTAKVQFIGKELPLIKLHKAAGYAAVSLRCAAQQDAYTQAKGLIFAKGTSFDNEFVEGLPSLLEIDKAQFDTCLKDIEQHNAITASINMAKMLGVKSTPSFVVGKREGNTLTDYQVITGASSVEEFAKVFDALSE